jgi:hypothetical protein
MVRDDEFAQSDAPDSFEQLWHADVVVHYSLQAAMQSCQRSFVVLKEEQTKRL